MELCPHCRRLVQPDLLTCPHCERRFEPPGDPAVSPPFPPSAAQPTQRPAVTAAPALACQQCDQGTMQPKTVLRAAPVLVFIGYALWLPAVLALVLATMYGVVSMIMAPRSWLAPVV